MATQTRSLPGVATTARRSEGVWRDAFGRLRKNKLALLGALGVFLLLFAGLFGPLLAPRPYQAQLDQAQSQVTLYQAQLELAKTTLARYQALDKSTPGAVSQQALGPQRVLWAE